MHWTLHIVGNVALLAGILTIVRRFERRNPVEANQSVSDLVTDWKLAGLKWVTDQLFVPITNALSIMVIAAAGGGVVPLRFDGWWFLFSATVLIVAIDFCAYFVHRAMHRFPLFWAMHSLHHSAEALTVITGARHFWLEGLITSPFFFVLGIVFRIPAEVVPSISLFYVIAGEALSHLNMRLSLGLFTYVINNPQYHRIHHSVEERHRNKNFCKLLPVFDVIFGTAWRPAKDEFPKTGLIPRETASGLIDGIIWPVRGLASGVLRPKYRPVAAP